MQRENGVLYIREDAFENYYKRFIEYKTSRVEKDGRWYKFNIEKLKEKTIKDMHIGIIGRSKVISVALFIIDGNNCKIEIQPSRCDIHQLVIQIAKDADNSKIYIGKDFSSQQATMSLIDKDTTIDIDDNCMLSWGIEILSSDGHTICDKKTNKTLNKSSKIKIGKHCWIGCKTIILKNVSLPDNTICGAGSVVSKSFSESFCAIAGNPAHVVKHCNTKIQN